ncbi:cache domain-containing protein [Demetria terragena]|uniref:cache domain-containing protein n=1 Tax=Demetria terragena TaxID=63959 RepID=UPI00039B42D1|nr:cache domain-containing protein [Demetria terragena]
MMKSEVADRVADVVHGVVERAFAPVHEVRNALARSVAEEGLPVPRSALAPLRDLVATRLGEKGAIQLGLGVVVAPEAVEDAELFLEWWQHDGGDKPRRLEFDLNRSSMGFYDYLSAEWFVNVRRTGQPGIAGPYVDVHGTDRYVFTMSAPIEAEGRFVGVAGGDLAVTKLEQLVLSELAGDVAEFVVLSDEDRVVLSTSGKWLVGSLMKRVPPKAQVRRLPDVPWRVAVRTQA